MKILIIPMLLLIISCGSNHDQARIDEMWALYSKLEKTKSTLGLDDDAKQLRQYATDLNLEKDHKVYDTLKSFEENKMKEEAISAVEYNNIIRKRLVVLEKNLSPHLANPDNYAIDVELLRHYNKGRLTTSHTLMSHINKILSLGYTTNFKEDWSGIKGSVYLVGYDKISRLGIELIRDDLLINAKKKGLSLMISFYFSKEECEISQKGLYVAQYYKVVKDLSKPTEQRTYGKYTGSKRFFMLRRIYEDKGSRWGLDTKERQKIFLEMTRRQRVVNKKHYDLDAGYTTHQADLLKRKARSAEKNQSYIAYAEEINITKSVMAKISEEGWNYGWLSYTSGAGSDDTYRPSEKELEKILKETKEIKY